MPPRIATQTGISRDQQRGDPGRDGLLAECDEPIPTAEQQRPDDRAVAPLARVGTTNARPSRAIDQASRMSAGDQEPDAAMRNGGIVSTAMAIPR